MKIRVRIVFLLFLFGGFSGSGWSGEVWKRLIRSPVVVYCHEEDVENGKRVISIAEEVLPGIAQDLKFSAVERIAIVITASGEEFGTLTGGQIPEWGVGAADPQKAILFLKSPRLTRPETNLRQVVVHELSHVVLGMVVGGKEIPRWFDEGFAQYESGEGGVEGTLLLARSFSSGEMLWLDEIDDVLAFRGEKVGLAYQTSRAAVDYLVETYGGDVLARIAWALRSEDSMDGALRLTIGMEFEDFETAWYHAMKHKYRWYVLLNFPVVMSTAFVLLFLAAFFVTWRRIRKKKAAWREEGWYEIEGMEERSTPG